MYCSWFSRCYKIQINLNHKEVSEFFPTLKRGRVIRVYDGDSITVAARIPELKNSKIFKFNIRLNRIDTPEIKTSNHIEKEYAIKVRDFLSEKIMNKMVNLEVSKTDKYGRYLSEVYYKKTNINNLLLNNKYAVKYDGGTKIAFNPSNFNEDLSEDVAISMSLTKDAPIKTLNNEKVSNIHGEFVI